MKQAKTKLMASVAMLLIAAVLLSSASFAWFTISTNPEVSGINDCLGANGNLEIALASEGTFTTQPASSSTADAGKNITWGNLVDISKAFHTTDANSTVVFKPVEVTLADGTMKAPKFGLDGRISDLTTLSPQWTALSTTPGTTDFDDGGIQLYKESSTATCSYAVRVDFFMRTNTAGTISLQETGVDRGAGEAGAGTTITSGSKATVAFQVDGGALTKFYDGTAASPAFDFTTPIITVADADKNKIYKVSMYVYWDGAGMTNADFTNLVQDLALNVQFKHSETLNDLGIDGTGHGKPTPQS